MVAEFSKDWPGILRVATPEELAAALQDWKQAPVVGVDTESNSFFAYSERLCLLQISCGENDYVVDPLALGEELRAINPLLAARRPVKVFHAAEFDLMLLKKDLGAQVGGLFDTQVAMTLLQYERTGLAVLIETCYGLKLSKKEQRSDWGRRPLREEQIEYARLDTHFLADLYQRLSSELREKGLMEAAEGEFRRLEREVLPARQPDPEGWRRLKGARTLGPAALARLQALFQWREETGRRKDLAVYRVLSNQALVELAAHPPRDLAGLAGCRGVGWRKARQAGGEILAALHAVDGKEVVMTRPTLSRGQRQHFRAVRQNQEALRKWRKTLAMDLGLPPERLIHRRHLEEIGKKLPRTSEDLNRLVILTDWQRENLETSLLEILEKLPEPKDED
ncbi:MAG: ribonuclease D [Planctomycetota bacterium]